MFSGIVGAAGTVVEARASGSGRSFTVRAPEGFLDGAVPGASIAVNGACQTAETLAAATFTFYSSAETLAVTNLGDVRPGAAVNLERALRLGDPVDGHLVTGHVDAVGRVRRLVRDGEAWLLELEIPAALLPLVAAKGSLAVDGVSLTVNRVAGNAAALTIVPFTLERTTLASRRPGDAVNLEADLLARYAARWLEAGRGAGDGRLRTLLAENGYGS